MKLRSSRLLAGKIPRRRGAFSFCHEKKKNKEKLLHNFSRLLLPVEIASFIFEFLNFACDCSSVLRRAQILLEKINRDRTMSASIIVMFTHARY